ncbi:MAG: tetratricopeptide repeat protein [bacterium]
MSRQLLLKLTCTIQKGIENTVAFKYYKLMIPKYDAYLEKYLKEYQENPRSRVFAPLAEAYRKSGLIDEAIEICKEGLEYHPNFLSGMVALARCYFDKGLYTATIKELEKVVSEVPDNYLAQKLLAESYILVGDKNNALKSYKMVLFMNSRDEEAKIAVSEIENIDRRIIDEELNQPIETEILTDIEDIPAPPSMNPPSFQTSSDFKIIDEVASNPDFEFEEKQISKAFNSHKEDDSSDMILTNISTMTMGELLESQGLKDKALEVYKKILDQHPDQPIVKEKIENLEKELGISSYKNDELETEQSIEFAVDSPEDYKQESTEDLFDGEIIDETPEEEKDDTTTPDIMNVVNMITLPDLPELPKEKNDRTDSPPNDLDDQWIFNNAIEDLKVTELKSLLNKVKIYRSSNIR